MSNLYVPPVDVYLENEAFRITGNAVEPLDCGMVLTGNKDKKKDSVITNVIACASGYHWDDVERACVPNNCPGGYYWDETQKKCLPNTPPSPPASTQPTGQILVYDNAINDAALREVPVKQTRVLLKRWFKIDVVTTDDNGRFATDKRFRRVDVTVIFDNSNLHVRGLRGARFYQMQLPVFHGIGKYSGNLNNVRHVFRESADFRSRTYRNWWAAQLMNAFQEYNTMATALGTGRPSTDMRILLTNWGAASGSGSTPMNHHRINNGTVPRDWISFFLADPARTGVTDLFNFLAQGIFLKGLDMTLGYNVSYAWTSDRVKALMFHELSHAAHFNKVGAAWWNSFVYAEEATIVRHTGANDPYGDGTDGISSEYISVGESWAEHMARTMCDRWYTINSKSFVSSGTTYQNGTVPGLTSHLSYLENYSPNNTNNPFRWIPEGIYYDLVDATNETSIPVIDVVSNFTNAQIFNAMDADVKSMPQYRERLIAENPNNQTTQVRNLFAQYRY